MQKSSFIPLAILTDGREVSLQKTYLCDMAKANACQNRAAWYGFDRIGPRSYAVYECPKHGKFRVRI